MKKALPIVQEKLQSGLSGVGIRVNNWGMIAPPIGTYGTDYLRRALIAFGGLGANVVKDAIYPAAFLDAAGDPFDSSAKYVLRFEKDQIPPVRAFWSLTMYNEKQLCADNPIDCYAIGDRDELALDADGSWTLYIQREPPSEAERSN